MRIAFGALALSRKESARRQDVRTLEALAWTLHKNGQSRDALVEMQKALTVGIKQPISFHHTSAAAESARDLLRSLPPGPWSPIPARDLGSTSRGPVVTV